MIDGQALSPRQTRVALDLLTGAVVVSVAFALAGLTWRIAGHAGTGAITVPSGRNGPAVVTDIAPALALAPFGRGVANEAMVQTNLPIDLRGVIAAQPAGLSTAFIAMHGQSAAPFHIGENIGGATIQGILRDRVILNNAGRSEYLTFPDPRDTAAPGRPPAPPSSLAPVPASPPGTAPANVAEVLQHFGATQADGGGYRIGSNPPPGLTTGDVLLSLNGTSLNDAGAATAAYAAAQSSGTGTLIVLRSGKRLTLTVPIR